MNDGTELNSANSSSTQVSNSNGSSTAQVTDTRTAQDVEQARREAEQAKMRANQLENELTKIRQTQAEAERKQLEEKQEFKTLYEQTQSKLEEIQRTQGEQDRKVRITQATEELYKEYPANVVDLAKTAGLGLADDSESAKTILKEKLDAFKAKLGGSGNSTSTSSNNNRETTANPANREEMTRRNAEGVSPMALASARGDNSVTLNYIKELPAIKRMREIARAGV